MKITFNNANEIIKSYVDKYGEDWLKEHFKQHCFIYQFVYATVFPKCYVLDDKDGINIKAKVALCHKKWVDSNQQKQPIAIAKEPLNYKERAVNESEQKAITEKLYLSVPKQQQSPKQLKRASVAAPVNFLTAK